MQNVLSRRLRASLELFLLNQSTVAFVSTRKLWGFVVGTLSFSVFALCIYVLVYVAFNLYLYRI